MQHVVIVENPLQPTANLEEHQVEDIHAFLQERWPSFPPTCRIYREHIAKTCDVTPHDEASAALLGSFTEKLYVVVYPAWAQIAAAAIVYTVAWVVTALTEQKPNKPKERVFATGSPNNALSGRENRARLHERVPDIFGTVRSVPDLIMETYTEYINHRPVEFSWMCVGRGKFAIGDIRENDTPLSQIQDSSAAVYPPGQLPGGGTPQLIVGDAIPDPIYSVYPIKAINGQDLAPASAFYCYGSGLNIQRAQKFNKWISMSFIRMTVSTGIILTPHNGDPDFVHSRIRTGDEIQVIFGALPTGGGPIPDLSAGMFFGADPTTPIAYSPGVGVPPVRADLPPLVVTNVVTRFDTLGDSAVVEVHVNIPTTLQAEWSKIPGYSGSTDSGVTNQPLVQNRNAIICPQSRWLLGYVDGITDPFSRGIFIDDPDCQQVWMNFVAPRGLYVEDGANRKVLTERLAWRLLPADENGNPTGGPAEAGTVDLKGSMIGGETRAVTVKFTRVTPGRCLLIVARTSNRVRQVDLEFKVNDTANSTHPFFRTTTFSLQFFDDPNLDPFPETPFTGGVVDDIKLTECYSMSTPVNPLGVAVTTIHSRVVANQSATRIEQRQLNCRASRDTGTWNGSIWQPLVVDTNGFVENMLFEALLDPFIGNRIQAEIDMAGIATAAAAVRAYFGDEAASKFSYTFDDRNMSAEETVLAMCRACFLTPYRQANVLKCDVDIATDNSTILFNHRNKNLGTEQRTVHMGLLNDNDGSEQQYVDVDAGIGIVRPISQFLSQPTVVAPVESRIVGLRFRQQAWWHAYRVLMRLIHQSVAVEFEAIYEAGLVGLNQRILVADNTDPETQDGEIVGVSGLVLRTSQPVVGALPSTYTLLLQGADGTTERLTCAPGLPDSFSITIGVPPVNPIIVDPNVGVPTKYILVRDQDSEATAMLVTDKEALDKPDYRIQAINYSHMYYMADGLTLWIVPSTEIGGEEMFDRSPYENKNIADNTMVGSDPVWGPVYDSTVGFLIGGNIASHIIAYSKFCWIKKDAGGSNGTILSSQSGNNELFALNSSNQLAAGHGGVLATAPVTAITEWHHYGVTYNSVTARMCLYIDGVQVQVATSVPALTLSALMAFNSAAHGALAGTAKHLRRYAREWSPDMVRELFRKELLQP